MERWGAQPPPRRAGRGPLVQGVAPPCCTATGKESSAGLDSSAGTAGRLAQGRGCGSGRRLAAICGAADGGRLESVDPSVGSDKAWAPEDEEEFTCVSLPTSVINPSCVSREVPVEAAAGASSKSLSLSDMIG